MKKALAVLLVSSLLLTGCGKENSDDTDKGGKKEDSGTLSCVKNSTDESGYKTTDNMEVTYKDGKVTKVKSISEAETDPKLITFTLNLGNAMAEKFSEINGITVKYSQEGDNKIKSVTEIDYAELDVNKLSELADSLGGESSSLYKKDIALDEFKTTNLEGYTCE